MLAELGERAGFVIQVHQMAHGLQEMLGLVAGGAGVAVIPADADQLPHPGVNFVKLRKPKWMLTSSAVWSKAKENPALLELIRLLKEEGT